MEGFALWRPPWEYEMDDLLGLREALREQQESFIHFRDQLRPSLSFRDARSYLEYWSQSSAEKIRPFSGKAATQLEKVWLEQRFELSPEEQFELLLSRFSKLLERLLVDSE